MYRQGDILIVSANEIPGKAKKINSRILAYGEATGHKHELEEEASVFKLNDDLYFKNSEPVKLNHDEHETIQIPEGTYRVIRQREFDEKEIRYVAD